MRLLIADDNPDDRHLAVRELRKHFGDLEVVEILSENDLKKALENFNFDIVLTDYRLRWGTGFDVLNAVRKVSPYTPVIMLTLTGNEATAVEAMKAGFDDYVLKSPKHIVKLPVAVEAVIEKKRKEMEADEYLRRLRESERKYRELWDNANDNFFIITPDGLFLDANLAALNTIGLSREDLGKIRIEDIVDEEFLKPVKERIRKIVETKDPLEPIEIRVKRKDGKKLWIELRSRPIVKNGWVVAIHGIARDVTKRKEYEEEIGRLNRLLKIVHEINDSLVREKDEDSLVKAIGDNLSKFYTSVFVGIAMDGELKFYPPLDESACGEEALTNGEVMRLSPNKHIDGCRHLPLHGHLFALVVPMMYNDKVKGVLIIHSEMPFTDDEVEILTTLSYDITFAINAIQLEEEKFLAYTQIERNIEQFAILVDQIRNPLAAASLIAEVEIEDEKTKEKILFQLKRIEEVIKKLDRGWLESENVRDFLRKSWEKVK
ncbi:PAS domain S-box protein [Archaeoglobus sp. UBA231]|nr:PAS domain S-box protein [Archaeoglobus sp. UBA231]